MYMTRDMGRIRGNDAIKATLRSARPVTSATIARRQQSSSSITDRLIAEGGHVGQVVLIARRSRTTVFCREDAEAKWLHQILGKELLLVYRRQSAGWFGDDEVTPKLMQIELKSRMDVLIRRYGREW